MSFGVNIWCLQGTDAPTSCSEELLDEVKEADPWHPLPN